jgi:hypothetical protein
MTNEELIKEIFSMPTDVRRKIEKIISSFRNRDKTSSTKPTKKRIPLRDEPFCGMWADREDMKDPVEWVRNIRKTQWDRSDRWKK